MKYMRSTIMALFAILFLISPALAAGTRQTISIADANGVYTQQEVETTGLLFNGEPMSSDVPSFLLGGRTMVPVRVISQQLGASVTWKGDTRQITVENGQNAIVLTVGSSDALVNGQMVKIYDNVPATLIQVDGIARTMVPLRFVSEYLGAEIGWDEATTTASISTIKQEIYEVSTPTLTEGKLTLTANTQTQPVIFDLPERVVIDLLGGVLSGETLGSVPVDSSVIKSLRFNQYDNGYDTIERVTRLVVDLQEGCTQEDLHISFEQGVLNIVPSHAVIDPELPEPEQPEPEKPEKPEPEKPEPEQPEPEKPKAPIVVLDAGHGGDDVGAPVFNTYEKDINLPITLMVGEMLTEAGYDVQYTRTDDATVSLAARAEFANLLNANLFISIHANAFPPKPEIHGIETYYLTDGQEAKVLAETVHKSLLKETGAADRKTRESEFYVLKHTTMPAILIETGYMTNKAEWGKLMTPQYQQAVARGIVRGVMEYLG